MHRKLLKIFFLALYSISAFASGSTGDNFPQDVYVVQGENYLKYTETGGRVLIDGNRKDASGGKCITSWNDKGHVLSWSVFIPEKGTYKIAIRYCHNRGGSSYRSLSVDGNIPCDPFKKISLPPTGGWSRTENNWKNLVISDKSGKPALVHLSWGVHRLTFENLGGDGQDGAAYIDLIAVMPPDVNPKVLGKTG